MPNPKEKMVPLAGKRSRGGPRDIRLTEVATLARVSPMTVSRALNNPEVVASETLKRIQLAVQQLGYVPNRLAGSLSSSRSRLIAAIVPTVTHSLFATSIQMFSTAMSRAGYQVLLGLSGYSDVDECQVLDALLSRRPEGLLLIGVARGSALRARLLDVDIPTVETWGMTDMPIDMLVGFSHYDVGVAVAERFLARGKLHPAIISANDERATARREGFIQTMARQGIDNVAQVLVKPPSSVAEGRSSLATILAERPDVDAVFCGSDLLALGVLSEARTRGLDVPSRLAVCGFGDLEFSADLVPALTTVQMDGGRIGMTAARCLIDRLDGSPARPKIDIGFTLVGRETA
ncbi:LacI family DNA-binding transcriptional regulator [Caballeronia sp. dw_19]|uniref:LacI family DNA-binding transcriptional regulator n=1 Tax=Caballeronia sp. dw_19 TaxID=2719791 RepID=UPI001BCF7B9E|nr:LacI family DNA-binding transcriptional regulator [Caballeronia sp. dw_19]